LRFPTGSSTRVKARVYAEAGISLSDAKRTLVVSRLSKLVRSLGSSPSTPISTISSARHAAEAQDFVNALTTNLTRFWREDHHFTHLRPMSAQLMQQRPRMGPQRPAEAAHLVGRLLDRAGALYDRAVLLDAFPSSSAGISGSSPPTSIPMSSPRRRRGLSRKRTQRAVPERAAVRAGNRRRHVRIPAVARDSFRSSRSTSWRLALADEGAVRRDLLPQRRDLFRQADAGHAVRPAGRKLLAPGGLPLYRPLRKSGRAARTFRLVGKTIYQSRAAQQKARDAA
jgi:chemotaxis protein methyltransferase CheR